MGWLSLRFKTVHVYLKCDQKRKIHKRVPKYIRKLKNLVLTWVDNVGREEYGYIFYIQARHPGFANWTVFLQADDVFLPALACFREDFSAKVVKEGWAAVTTQFSGGR